MLPPATTLAGSTASLCRVHGGHPTGVEECPRAEIKHPKAGRRRVDAQRDHAQRRDQSFQHVVLQERQTAGWRRDAAPRLAVGHPPDQRMSQAPPFVASIEQRPRPGR